MEARTLQQQIPVYHVCQECGGEGCIDCSDLCIVYGDIEFNVDECIRDIQLDPDYAPEHTVDEQLEWLDAFSERVQLLAQMAPINGVIGTTPDYPFSTEARLANVNKLIARMPYRSVRSEDNRVYLEGCGIWSDK